MRPDDHSKHEEASDLRKDVDGKRTGEVLVSTSPVCRKNAGEQMYPRKENTTSAEAVTSDCEGTEEVPPIVPFSPKDILHAPISQFSNCQEKTGTKFTLHEEIERIKNGYRQVPQTIKKLRQQVEAEAEKEVLSELKRRLPAVTLSGYADGLRKKASSEDRFTHSGCLQVDIDGLKSPADAERIKKLLSEDPHIIAIWISPSGLGVKALLYIQAQSDEEAHKTAFAAAERYFEEKYGLTIDPATKDTARLCYTSFDPDIIIREQIYPLDLEKWQPPVKQAPARKTSGQRPSQNESKTTGSASMTLEELEAMVDVVAAARVRAIADGGDDLSYHDWLHFIQGIFNEFGRTDDVLAILEKLECREHDRGTTGDKMDERLEEIGIGSAIHIAKTFAGWSPKRKRGKQRSRHESSNADDKPVPFVDLVDYELTDSGNAERFLARHGHEIRFVHGDKQWIRFDGNRWKVITRDQIVEMMRLVLRGTDAAVVQSDLDIDARATVHRQLKKATNAKPLRDAVDLVPTFEDATVAAETVDADPMLLGTKTGVLDLRTGEMLPASKDLLVVKTIGCEFSPDATAPLWERFINTVTNRDTALEEYLQKVVGYTLTGLCTEQCMFFLYGHGQNGKGVFCETIKALFGDYAKTVPESLLVKTGYANVGAASPEVAMLKGLRFALTPEVEEGATLAEARVKTLTGNDSLTARKLYRDPVNFQPTHKIVLCGNHKPNVRGASVGIWRRLRVLPFSVCIPEEDRDPKLLDKLKQELPGILNWALAGTKRWHAEGMKTPACVSKITERYRKDEDLLGRFLEECCIVDAPDVRLLGSALYERFKTWSEAEGIRNPPAHAGFSKKLAERGMMRVKSRGLPYWLGIRLK